MAADHEKSLIEQIDDIFVEHAKTVSPSNWRVARYFMWDGIALALESKLDLAYRNELLDYARKIVAHPEKETKSYGMRPIMAQARKKRKPPA